MWTTSYHGRLAVRAACKDGEDGLEQRSDLAEGLGELPRGAVTRMVVLAHVTQGHKGPWVVSGQYDWLLREPGTCAEPVPVAGPLGLWERAG